MCGSTIFKLNAGKKVGCGRGCDNNDKDDNEDDGSPMANAGFGFSSAFCRDPQTNTCPLRRLLARLRQKMPNTLCLAPSRVREYMMKGDERRLVHGP